MEGQFEQELNAFMLAGLGYGKNASSLVDESIGDFLYRIPDYQQRIAGYPAADNSAIQQKVSAALFVGGTNLLHGTSNSKTGNCCQ